MTHAEMQVSSTPAPMAPPAPPAQPVSPTARVAYTVPGPNGTTRTYTMADVAALQARKEELSRQIRSADARRREVQRSLRGAVGADKAGLEARLGVLDARIARLEADIDENSSQLASLDVTRLRSSTGIHWGPDTGNNIGDNAMPLALSVVFFVLAPFAFAMSRLVWKRGSRPMVAAPSPDTTQRLERMEQAMEAIAVEIERISEGQRFVTRLMSEGRAGALGAAPPEMEPVPLPGARVAGSR